MRTGRLLVVSMLTAAALAAPASAGPAKTFRLAWSEKAVDGGRTVMSFHVRTLKVEGKGGRWTISASFRNASRVRLGVRRQFAVLHGPAGQRVKALRVLPAKTFKPALPASLAPGKGWSGTFSGTGAAALKNTSVRVRFSYFSGRAVAGRPGFGWITDHVARLG